MLKRKWIIDSRGGLVGIWTDLDQPRSVPVYLTEKPRTRIVHANRSRPQHALPTARPAGNRRDEDDGRCEPAEDGGWRAGPVALGARCVPPKPGLPGHESGGSIRRRDRSTSRRIIR